MKKLLTGVLALLVTTQMGFAGAAWAAPATSDAVAVQETDGSESLPAEPPADETPSPEETIITICDLVAVAGEINGDAHLSEAQLQKYDLTGDGAITISDLVLLASRVEELIKEDEAVSIALERVPGASEENVTAVGSATNEDGNASFSVEITYDGVVYLFEIDARTGEILSEASRPDFAVPDPAYQTVAMRATISSVNMEDNSLEIQPTDSDAEDEPKEIIARLGADCAIVNAETGAKQEIGDLEEGDSIIAYLSVMFTASIPPQAECYAIVTNETGLSHVDYVRVLEAREGDYGVTVLNQNADLYVTIPDSVPLEVFGEDATASPDEIEQGSRLLVWYEFVLESYPGQATATRAMLIPATEISPA